MRVYRCFARLDGVKAGDRLTLSAEESRHLVSVRRAAARLSVVLCDGEGTVATGTLERAAHDGALVRIEALEAQPEPSPARELALALTRTDAFDDALHRAVELGVTAIHPVLGDHSVVDLDGRRAEKRVARWERITVEALKQCERAWLPGVSAPAPLHGRLEDFRARGITPVALLERDRDARPLHDMRGTLLDRDIAVLVGPEGGWSGGERALLVETPGVLRATLGDAILRAETAAIAALAIVMR
jgi:16S rRNA (uracil1498-N3)-methyltransferase